MIKETRGVYMSERGGKRGASRALYCSNPQCIVDQPMHSYLPAVLKYRMDTKGRKRSLREGGANNCEHQEKYTMLFELYKVFIKSKKVKS